MLSPQGAGGRGGGGGGGGGDDVYFIESGDDSEREDTVDPHLTPQEKGDMLRAKVRTLHQSGHLTNQDNLPIRTPPIRTPY